MGYIYLISNKVNGKCYVGLSKGDARKDRIDKHLSGKGNQLIKKDLKRYGRNAFSTKLIHRNVPNALLIDFEKQEIKRYNSVVPNGYNLTSGGESSSQASSRMTTSQLLNNIK